MKSKKLEMVASGLLRQADKLQQLREFGNRKNYAYKVKQLATKLQEQYDFYSKKNSSSLFVDVKKDLIFIQSQLNEINFNKEKIDLLVKKYNIGYDKGTNY